MARSDIHMKFLKSTCLRLPTNVSARILTASRGVAISNLANDDAPALHINDRGPWVLGRYVDLSHTAARAFGMGRLRRGLE
jgi:hypothetical protein